jgi:hypothetical protein
MGRGWRKIAKDRDAWKLILEEEGPIEPVEGERGENCKVLFIKQVGRNSCGCNALWIRDVL